MSTIPRFGNWHDEFRAEPSELEKAEMCIRSLEDELQYTKYSLVDHVNRIQKAREILEQQLAGDDAADLWMVYTKQALKALEGK